MLNFFDHSSESLFNRLIFITRWILNCLFKTLSLALWIWRFFLISRNSVLFLHLFKFLSLLFNIIWKFWKWTLKFFQNFIFIKFVNEIRKLRNNFVIELIWKFWDRLFEIFSFQSFLNFFKFRLIFFKNWIDLVYKLRRNNLFVLFWVFQNIRW